MSDERKKENEIISYSVNRGKSAYASEMKGNGTVWELSHVRLQGVRNGTRRESLSIAYSSQQQSLFNFTTM